MAMGSVDIVDQDDPHQEADRWITIQQSAKVPQFMMVTDGNDMKNQSTAPHVQGTTRQGKVGEGRLFIGEFVDNVLDELYGKSVSCWGEHVVMVLGSEI